MVRGAGQEYRGQRLAGLAHEIFLKLLKAKREVPGAAERQKTWPHVRQQIQAGLPRVAAAHKAQVRQHAVRGLNAVRRAQDG